MKLQCVPHLILFLMCPAGCRTHQAGTPISTARLSPGVEAENVDQLWNSAQETLRDYRFRLDRVDRQAGVITTLPMGSKHFFEVWRKDVATRADLWESTVNPLRRWVEVKFSTAEGERWSDVEVIVHKERLSMPDRQFNSTVAAFQYFGNAPPGTTGESRGGNVFERWIDLGRDAVLEDVLLRRILEEAGAATPEANG